MGYDQRLNSGNPAVTLRPPISSGAVTNPGFGVAQPGLGAFASAGGRLQESVAPGGYPSSQGSFAANAMPLGGQDAGSMPNSAANPAMQQMAANIQQQQPYTPGSPTQGMASLGTGGVGGSMGAFAGGRPAQTMTGGGTGMGGMSGGGRR